MCSAYIWLDFFCWNQGDLVNVVFFSEHRVRIYDDLFNRKKHFICPNLHTSQFQGKLDFSEKLPEVLRKVHFHLVTN